MKLKSHVFNVYATETNFFPMDRESAFTYESRLWVIRQLQWLCETST